MWATIKRLNEERGKILADMKALITKGETEKRDLNAEEIAKFDELRKKSEKLAEDLTRAQTAAAIEGELRGQGQPGRDGIDPNRPLGETRELSGFAVKDLSRYSLLRALRCAMNKQPLDGVEAEVSTELAKRSGQTPKGFLYPTDIPVGFELRQMTERRDVTTTTVSGAIPTIVDTSQFITILRNRIACQQMGARFLPGLQGMGTLSLPKQTGAATGYWVAEEGAPTSSNQTIGQVSFTPKTVGAYTDISRNALMQSAMSLEALVRDDLAMIIAIAIDLAALNGLGSSNQPLGILQNGSVGVVSNGTNGGVPTWANILAMETNVAQANVTGDSLGYLTNSKVRGLLKATLQSATAAAARWIWEATDNPLIGEVNGYKAMNTTQIPSNLTKGSGTGLSAMIYGNWSDLVIALWGQLDVLVDPYTGSNTGTVRVNVHQSADINVRHAESFQIMTDITA